MCGSLNPNVGSNDQSNLKGMGLFLYEFTFLIDSLCVQQSIQYFSRLAQGMLL